MLRIKDHLRGLVVQALGDLGVDLSTVNFDVTEPARAEFGEFATNAAMVGAKVLGTNPRDLASRLVEQILNSSSPYLKGAELAGPGFVNFRLNNSWLYEDVSAALSMGVDGYGRSDIGKGKRLLLEFVSANPTGPLHLGNGWWASYGDSLGRLLAFVNYDVSTEYYVNDTGGQIRALGESLLALAKGEAVPEGGYSGEYVSTLARGYDGDLNDVTAAGKFASDKILVMIKESLSDLGITFDTWYSQASIEESGAVGEVVELLKANGAIEIQDGKSVFMATRYGDNRDRFLTKANGDYTYLAGDIAYHYDKLVRRGFDYAIDIFGADHQGQVPSLLGAMSALGCEPSRLEILLGQMVSLQRGDEVVKFSKRKGNVVDLQEVTKEIGASAMRLLSLQTSIDRSSVVDLAVVTSKSMDNPVYYIQYAHARMAAIERMRIEREIPEPQIEDVDLSLLVHPRELELLKIQSRLDEVVSIAATERAPYKIVTWLRDFAGAFHGFYHDCSVLGDGPELTQARLCMVRGAQVAIKVALSLVGVEALERM